jgi:hypothetical protein
VERRKIEHGYTPQILQKKVGTADAFLMSVSFLVIGICLKSFTSTCMLSQAFSPLLDLNQDSNRTDYRIPSR